MTSTPVSRRDALLVLAGAFAAPHGAKAQPSILELGVLPNISPRVLLAQYEPMRKYLARELQATVQVSTAPGWNAFHARTVALEYDLVVTAAHLARLAQLDKGFVPLVSYAPPIKGLLVVAKARPIAAVSELKGGTLVLSNPQSLVTFRGMNWLDENGLQRDRDFRTISTPTDDSVGSVVLRGDAVAAMISGGEFLAIPEAIRQQLQLLTVFAEVPGFVALASPRLAGPRADALKAHLLAFANGSEEGKAFFASTGFVAMREVAPGLMESMDTYVAATRRMLSA